MTLKELVDELGPAEVARRLRVIPRTLYRWISQGVPQREQSNVERIIANEVARKYPTPVGPWDEKPGYNWLPSEALRPTRAPQLDSDGDGVLPQGESDLEGTYPGEAYTFKIDQPVPQVDLEELWFLANKVWKKSKHPLYRVVLIFMRMIARWNPLYRGDMLKKLGTWQQWTPVSTAIWADIDTMWEDMDDKFNLAVEQAKRRPQYLMQFQVHVFEPRQQ